MAFVRAALLLFWACLVSVDSAQAPNIKVLKDDPSSASPPAASALAASVSGMFSSASAIASAAKLTASTPAAAPASSGLDNMLDGLAARKGAAPSAPNVVPGASGASKGSRGQPRFARMWAKLGAKRLGTRRAGTGWKSERTPGKGEMYHWIKWPHAGLANLVTGLGGDGQGAAGARKYEGPVQNTGNWVRGAAGSWDERKQILQDEVYEDIAKIGDAPRSYRTGGLPVPCDTPFKCKARLRDKQVSCCQVCPDELYLPADRYYGADEHIEKDPFRPMTRDAPAPKAEKTESESSSESLSGSDAGGPRTAQCPAAIDDEFVLPCCIVALCCHYLAMRVATWMNPTVLRMKKGRVVLFPVLIMHQYRRDPVLRFEQH